MAEQLKTEMTDLGGINQEGLLKKFSGQDWWDEGKGWKNLLNNLRLILQAFLFWNLIKPWLRLFNLPQLELGFAQLMEVMNGFRGQVPVVGQGEETYFSSA